MDPFVAQVTVIIPTYNGANRIRKTLKALAHQTYSSFELIIVIDGSSDDTEEVIQDYRTNFRAINVIRQQNSGRAGARNRGSSEASGSLLIFYDDDMIPEKRSVQAHVEAAFSLSENAIIAGNQVENPERSYREIERYRCFLRSEWIKVYPNGIAPLDEKTLYLTAANFSISKKLFQELNGFDESFSDGEDFDLAIRAFKKGVKIYFDKSNVAFHEDQATVRSYIERRRQYEKAGKQLREKHPDFVAPLKRSFLKKTIYFLFSFELWVIAIEKGYLKFLPQKIRYKIYTLTIWGLSQYFPNKKLS